MRIVCDTTILVRANPESTGPSHRLLVQIRRGRHILIVSPPLLDELEATLVYPRLQKLWPATNSQIREFRDAIEQFAHVVEPAQGPPVVPKDPDDDVVVYTAVAGRADSRRT